MRDEAIYADGTGNRNPVKIPFLSRYLNGMYENNDRSPNDNRYSFYDDRKSVVSEEALHTAEVLPIIP